METEGEYLARIKADLRLANARLDEELGEQEKLIAFPYGAYNDDVLKIGDELGFRLYFTTEPGMNYTGSRIVYRINAGSPEITANKLLKKMRQLHGPRAN
jgi:biofilm PGA synthesis lipoprotein PgaB